MLKKFLHGLAFGAGFTIAMLGVWTVGSWGLTMWLTSGERVEYSSGPGVSSGPSIDTPPALSDGGRFLGSTGSYSGDSNAFRGGDTLATGPGKIVGMVTSNGAPVAGLRLRLALNGSVMSAWATSDAQGTYTVEVPFGLYRIDGYELAFDSANSVLRGKIDRPGRRFPQGFEFEVSQDRAGEGLTLAYVDPVDVLGPRGTISSNDRVTLTWAPYPGAERYSIQLHEVPSGDDYANRESLFDIRSRPEVTGTSFELAANGVTLKNGYSYTIEILARDAAGRALAESPSRWGQVDFRVVD